MITLRSLSQLKKEMSMQRTTMTLQEATTLLQWVAEIQASLVRARELLDKICEGAGTMKDDELREDVIGARNQVLEAFSEMVAVAGSARRAVARV